MSWIIYLFTLFWLFWNTQLLCCAIGRSSSSLTHRGKQQTCCEVTLYVSCCVLPLLFDNSSFLYELRKRISQKLKINRTNAGWCAHYDDLQISCLTNKMDLLCFARGALLDTFTLKSHATIITAYIFSLSIFLSHTRYQSGKCTQKINYQWLSIIKSYQSSPAVVSILLFCISHYVPGKLLPFGIDLF